jgi:hypothetical protein
MHSRNIHVLSLVKRSQTFVNISVITTSAITGYIFTPEKLTESPPTGSCASCTGWCDPTSRPQKPGGCET